MAITERERQYLTYRPKYGYASLYMAKPYKGSSLPEYEPSKCIEGLTNVLPSSILKEIASLLDNLTVIQKRLEQCLAHQKGNITFSQYKHELGQPKPNYHLLNQYEHTQRTSLDGTIQGEVYKYVLDAQVEFIEYSDKLDKFMYGSKATLPIDKKVDEDKQYIDNMIKKDMARSLSPNDVTQIGVKTQLNYYALERTINAQEYVRGLNSVCTCTLNDRFDGNVVVVLQGLADTDLDNVRRFNNIGKVSFRKAITKAENDRMHGDLLNSSVIKAGLNETMFSIATATMTSAQPLLTWASSISSDDDNSPMTFLIEEILDRLEFIDKEHSQVMQSMFGHNKLDVMQKRDLISTLIEKKTSRMLVNVIDEMITEREKGTFDMDKFLKKHKLLEPGNMCTK